jgi:hypothetical protein
MPADIRREVCRRLADNEPAASVIAWIEETPAARAVLDEQFDGARVLPQNLSEWKKNPEFARFVRQREEVASARAQSEFALEIAKAAGGVSAGSIAILGGKILQMLEGADPDAASSLIKEVIKLRAREQKDDEIALKKRAAAHNERKIVLAEAQFRAKTAELFLEWHNDKRVQEIVNGTAEKTVKLDGLQKVLFGEKPEGLEFA